MYNNRFALVELEDGKYYLHQIKQNNLLVPHSMDQPCKLLHSDTNNDFFLYEHYSAVLLDNNDIRVFMTSCGTYLQLIENNIPLKAIRCYSYNAARYDNIDHIYHSTRLECI